MKDHIPLTSHDFISYLMIQTCHSTVHVPAISEIFLKDMFSSFDEIIQYPIVPFHYVPKTGHL